MKRIEIAEAQRFFDRFVEAFASFRGEDVALRYRPPFLAVDATGGARAFTTSAAIAAYFQTTLDGYRAQGCATCRYRDLQLADLGGPVALLTVTWELLRTDGVVVHTWRESYVVVRQAGSLAVTASIDHAT